MMETSAWAGLRYLFERPGNIVPADFEPGPEILDFLRHESRCAGI